MVNEETDESERGTIQRLMRKVKFRNNKTTRRSFEHTLY
jgi:hypothetical protein